MQNNHKNIKFSLEIKENDSINFLYLKISRTCNKFSFGIFYKKNAQRHDKSQLFKSPI